MPDYNGAMKNWPNRLPKTLGRIVIEQLSANGKLEAMIKQLQQLHEDEFAESKIWCSKNGTR